MSSAVRIRLPGILVVCAAFVVPDAARAQTLFADPLTSNPPNASNDIPLNRGKKGLLYRFKFFDATNTPSTAGFPMNLTSAAVSLTIGTNAPLPCSNGTTAPPNQCVFTANEGDTPDGVLDYVKIVYGSDFPANVKVDYQVSNARSSAGTGGVVQDPSNQLVSFQTTTSTMPPPTRTAGVLELVFDISGSMELKAVPGGAFERIQVLRQATQQLFTMLPEAVVPGDKIGAVFFASTAAASSPALVAANDAAQRQALLNDIVNKAPTTATSIGGGLKVAAPILTGDPAPRKYVLLFSDGEQNTSPCVGLPNNANCTGTVNSPLAVDGAPYIAASVCPILTGQMSAPGYAVQQAIGQVACDKKDALKIPDGSDTIASDDMQTFFAQIITKVFPGDKIEVARDVSDSLVAGQTKTAQFFAGTHDISMTISVTWGGQSRHAFTLKAPNGTMIDLSKVFDFQPGVTTVRLRLPIIQNNTLIPTKGLWELGFTGGTRGPFQYHALVLLDNEILASDFRIPTADAGTGEPITVQATLTEDGAPITGGTVGVQVSGPAQGLGQMLATAPNPAGSPPATGDVYRDAAAQKVAKLASDPAFANLFADQSLPALVLRDDGLAGDATANDGIYIARLAATTLEGHYRFNFAAQATTTRNGTFQRSWKSVIFVRAKPDANNTSMVVVSSTPQLTGAVVHLVRLTPKDRFGNMLGPGYLGYLQMNPAPPSTVVAPLVDNLNGTYDVRISVPPGQLNPPITVVVLGTPVFTRPLSPTATNRFFSLHVGTAIPSSDLSNAFNPSLSLGADVEFKLQRIFSVEGYLGYDRFAADVSGLDDLAITNASVSGKATFGSGAFRSAVEGGVGAYFASGSGSGTHFGWSAGASLQYWLTPRRALDASYRFRSTHGGDWQYSTVQAGVRLAF